MCRQLLGVLALRANTTLATDWLVDALWPGSPPRSAESNLRSYLADIRRVLPGWLTSGPNGLVLRAAPDQLDVLAFCREIDLARGLSGAAAAASYGRALAYWRGPVLDGLPIPEAVRIEAQVLEDRRLDVTEDWCAARLEAGHDPDLINELQALVERAPLRERRWQLLMLAQYRSGRQADALAGFRRLQGILDDELGVEPSPQTIELHRRIQRGDPELASRSTVPRQLPSTGPHLVGRKSALDGLSDALPGVAVVSGMAGVGKTALAIHWARAAAAEYPDGCLYVDLRGYGPGQPVEPAEVLAGFLRAFGVTDQPTEVTELAARYRTELGGRRVLVVLDNARDVSQVRPLLPGTGGVLVTSRDALAGLVARDGAKRIDLDVLTRDDSLRLLQSMAAGVVEQDPAAADELVRLCGRLPLALCIVAELVVARSAGSLRGLVTGLTDEHLRLDRLTAGGDQATGVRSVFSWSVKSLPDGPAKAFGLLGAHPARDLALPAVAALLDADPFETADWLDALHRAHLVTVDGDRYGMHDLLRAYARDLTAPELQSAAIARLTSHYLRTASTAMDLLYPGEFDARPRVAAGLETRFSGIAEADDWFAAEIPALVAVAGLAAELTGPDTETDSAGLLADMVWRHMFVKGFGAEAMALHGSARRAAQARHDPAAEATAVKHLASTNYLNGDNQQARQLCEEALGLCRLAGDRIGEGGNLVNLGLMCWILGDPRAALEYQVAALAIQRELGNRLAEGHILLNIGLLDFVQGRTRKARSMYEAALVINREVGDPYGEYLTLDSLGSVLLRLGRSQEALDRHQASVAICHTLGSEPGQLSGRRALAVALTSLGRYDEAADHLRVVLEVMAATGHRELARALNDLANLDRARGDLLAASTHHDEAVALARQDSDRYLEVEILNDSALTLDARGNHERAMVCRATVQELAAEIGAYYELVRATRQGVVPAQ
ncbi:tetratricopeptide repeat protein [Kribbella sp. NBC_00382]|uniref:AfsR/SARP family transcriptional regulator n=1 Tax=Kribbella sp. NBC_00382 TaxID=2975967 RepID=UPI002E1B3581